MMIATVAMTVKATDYTDRILVLVNGEGTEQTATITVTEHDGVYDLNLKNFVLMNGDQPMPVGNVELTNITPETSGGSIFLRALQTITIAEGDLDNVLFWLGPSLGELPVEVTAVVKGDQLRALIHLDLMETMEQIIDVSFGEGLVTGKEYHIPNGGFEEWHASSGNYQEPNAWHSFESATGDFAILAGNHISKSDKGRNDSSCARIFATSIFGIIANGTMTTGRMNAGAMSAENTQNNAYLDMSLEETDGNGEPFYVALSHRPDSLVMYVQFHQGKANSDHPYASVSAVITDGTYYQDPENKTYNNVVAKAANREIAVTGDEWQRIAIPFVYTSNDVEPKAILITISTNADPGQGSKDDEVLVDDLTLVYNHRLSSLNVEGFSPDKFEYEVVEEMSVDELTPVADGQGTYVLTTLEETDEGKCAVVKVYAEDLRASSTYTIRFGNGDNKPTAIQSATVVNNATPSRSIYDLQGRKVGNGSMLLDNGHGNKGVYVRNGRKLVVK